MKTINELRSSVRVSCACDAVFGMWCKHEVEAVVAAARDEVTAAFVLQAVPQDSAPRETAAVCPNCKDSVATRTDQRGTVFVAHASKSNSPRQWCRQSGQPVPSSLSEPAYAPEGEGALP